MTKQIKINTGHIGDDNDYSCFLYRAVYKMWLAGMATEAFMLFNTDTMLVREFTEPEFIAEMERRVIAIAQQEVEDAEYAKAWSELNIN